MRLSGTIWLNDGVSQLTILAGLLFSRVAGLPRSVDLIGYRDLLNVKITSQPAGTAPTLRLFIPPFMA